LRKLMPEQASLYERAMVGDAGEIGVPQGRHEAGRGCSCASRSRGSGSVMHQRTTRRYTHWRTESKPKTESPSGGDAGELNAPPKRSRTVVARYVEFGKELRLRERLGKDILFLRGGTPPPARAGSAGGYVSGDRRGPPIFCRSRRAAPTSTSLAQAMSSVTTGGGIRQSSLRRRTAPSIIELETCRCTR